MREIKLTKNDEKIFEEIKRLVKLNQKHTCAQIAEQIGTAPSSIIKLAKKMGYSGWNEMYYSLSRIYSDAVPLSINNFDFLSEGKIFEKTRQLMELLQAYKDRKIVIGCVGDSEFLTNYLLDKLCQRDYSACRYTDRILSGLREAPGEPGLCVFVNESGILLVDACIRFQELGYRVYSVTSSTETPLAAKSDFSVEIKNKKSSVDNYLPNFFAARTLIFLELLFAEIDERNIKAD